MFSVFVLKIYSEKSKSFAKQATPSSPGIPDKEANKALFTKSNEGWLKPHFTKVLNFI